MKLSAYGGSTGSVLSSTTGNVGNVAVGNNVVIAIVSWVQESRHHLHSHRHVLLLGEDGVVRLKVVLLQVFGTVLRVDLDVELFISLLPD